VEWPEYKLVIEPHEHRQFGAGVIVRQGPEDTDCYFARDWRLPEHEELLSRIVDACVKRGLIHLLSENAPQSDRRGINGDGVRYIGFGQFYGRGRAPAWDCTFDSRVYGGLKEFVVNRRYEPVLLAAFGDTYKSVVRPESGGGQHLLVKLSRLESALDAVVGKISRTTGLKPMNTILYGPPGTGKTYNTAERAVKICDPSFSGGRAAMMSRYGELSEKGQIAFVTFHQSFGYEDFVEGIRPTTEGGNIAYAIRKGVFLEIAMAACENYVVSESAPPDVRNVALDFDAAFLALLESINASQVFVELSNDYRYQLVEGNGSANTLLLEDPQGLRTSRKPIHKHHLRNLWQHREKIRSIADVKQYSPHCPNPSYHRAVLKKMQGNNPAHLQGGGATEPKPTENFCLIIDEINRANISKVFGELITLLEEDKRLWAVNQIKVTLPYSGEEFGIPPNLYVLGTMNTADRSIALLDIALRRRFNFVEMEPQPDLLDRNVEGVNLAELLTKINIRIEFLLDRDHRIGHAYFMNIKSIEDLNDVFRNRIIPLLQEYFYDDWQRIVQVLATRESGGKACSAFITEISAPKIPGVEPDRLGSRYRVNAEKTEKGFTVTDYQHIYNPESNNASAAE